tara:strand:- start:35 stop:376 length:342 start_codon:yes stop_codon:yes gene_type:complete
MSQLSRKIELYLGRTPNFESEVILWDNGDGVPYIKKWNASDKIEPTKSQLDALESQATKDDNNFAIRQTRKSAYGDIGEQLDLLYKDLVAGKVDATGEWAKKIKAIKDANAKE